MDEPGAEAADAYRRGLEPFWHPVLSAAELRERPLLVELLGRPLVLARLAGGPACLDDTCRHLGASLSVGEVVDGCLRCAYHGWTYRRDGVVVDIPARRGAPIPREARLRAYPIQEAYGLLWVRLEGAGRPSPPEFPEYSNPLFRATPPRRYEPWAASAPRLVMAALDDTHFPWVHPGLLGDRDRPQPPDHQVRREADQLVCWYTHLQPANESVGGAAGSLEQVTYTNRCTPTTIRLVKQGPAGTYSIFLCVSPLNATRSKVWLLTARDFDLDAERDAHYLEFEDRIQAQDRRVVESQRPWLLPPLASRLMLYVRPADLPLIAFQKWLEELGIPQI